MLIRLTESIQWSSPDWLKLFIKDRKNRNSFKQLIEVYNQINSTIPDNNFLPISVESPIPSKGYCFVKFEYENNPIVIVLKDRKVLNENDTLNNVPVMELLKSANETDRCWVSSEKLPYKVKELLACAYSVYNKFNKKYFSSNDEFEGRVEHSTGTLAKVLYSYYYNDVKDDYLLIKYGVAKCEPPYAYISESIKALNNLKSMKDSSFINTLKLITELDEVSEKNANTLVSLVKVNSNFEKSQQEIASHRFSTFQGTVGEKIIVKNIVKSKLIREYTNAFGLAYMYQFEDDKDNVYIWYSSSKINDIDNVHSIQGTVKAHNKYNDIEQTILTRCKILN